MIIKTADFLNKSFTMNLINNKLHFEKIRNIPSCNKFIIEILLPGIFFFVPSEKYFSLVQILIFNNTKLARICANTRNMKYAFNIFIDFN